MEKIIDSNPSPYPKTNIPEYNSVITLYNILDKIFVKPDLKVLDKFPNTDGIIELVTAEQRPIGKLDIQIKTLAEVNKNNPKYQCNLEFLSYCENSLLPVILIVVDNESERAFWIYICHDILITLSKQIKGESINVDIPSNNIITKTEKQYIKEWSDIINSRLTRLIDYDSIKEELIESHAEYLKLKGLLNPALGIESENFKEIHLFLDHYNYLLDSDFNVIKEIFYPDSWKMGLAYSKFNDSSICYSVYPISYTQNDIQIKELDLYKEFSERKIKTYKQCFIENPIKNKPVEQAYSHIINDLAKIIDNMVLLPVNEFIANEYIINFINHNNEILGLEKNQEYYKFNDIKEAFNSFLPLVCDTFLKTANIDHLHPILIDLDSLISGRNITKRNAAIKSATESKFKGEYSKHTFSYKSKRWNFKYLDNLIKYLELNNLTILKKPFSIDKTLSNYEDLKSVLFKVYSELPILYDRFIVEYFSKLRDQINYFSDFNRLIINLNPEMFSNNENQILIEERIYLKSTDNPIEKKIDVFLIGKDQPHITWKDLFRESKTEYIIEENKYILLKATTREINPFPKESLMLEYIYEALKDRLENHLKPYKEGNSKIFKSQYHF